MLAAGGTAGTELRPYRQRHLGGAAGHERQLRRLVEQLVEAHTDEIEIHHLDHRAHTRHRRADAQAHDRGLRDRRVAHTITELVVQAAHQPEHVAANADVDTRDEHAIVRGELGFERGSDRVHRPEHRRIVRGRRWLCTLWSRTDDEVRKRRGLGTRELARGLECFVELLCDRCFHRGGGS